MDEISRYHESFQQLHRKSDGKLGLINRLAEIDDTIDRVGRLMAHKTDDEIANYVAFPDHRLTTFDPWANPFDYDSFLRSCREMIESIFSRGLRPGQRWGFKEIRYHCLLTVCFLDKLFPTPATLS